MVQGTNRSIIYDFIEFFLKPYSLNSVLCLEMYQKRGLSASQIAKEIGCSKTSVLKQLRAQGVHHGDPRRTDPENYKLHDPPYGFSKRDGRLVPNKSELRICRVIISLDSGKGLSARAIGKELEARGIKNRKGAISWTHGSIKRILARWKGKI